MGRDTLKFSQYKCYVFLCGNAAVHPASILLINPSRSIDTTSFSRSSLNDTTNRLPSSSLLLYRDTHQRHIHHDHQTQTQQHHTIQRQHNLRRPAPATQKGLSPRRQTPKLLRSEVNRQHDQGGTLRVAQGATS